MKDEVIRLLFDSLTPSLQKSIVSQVREQYCLTDEETLELFSLTKDQFNILFHEKD